MSNSSADEPGPGDRTTLTLIRHGESEVTVDRVIGGVRTCRGLSPLGRRQAESLRERLLHDRDIVPDVVISSDFARAIETAEVIAVGFGFGDRVAASEIEQWPEFGEHDPGPDIDGMTFEAYVERFGTPDWSGDPDVEIFPGGETTGRFYERVEHGLATLLQRFGGRHVAVTCHGGVIDATFRILLGLRRTGGFELQTLNTAITVFSANVNESEPAAVSWRLERYNDAAHLAGLPDASPRRT